MTIAFEPSWSLVDKHLKRVKLDHGKVRKQVAAELHVTSSALSAWVTDNEQPKISPGQILSFAKAVGLSAHEIAELTAVRLIEEDGKRPALDLDLLMKFIEYLLPQGDEKIIVEVLNEETTGKGFNDRLLDSPENREVIRATIRALVRKECDS